MYSSTCFGRPHAHHQEINNCSSSLWFYCWSMLIAALLVVVRPAVNRPDHDHQCCYHHAPMVKPKAANAVVELLMMGVRMSETCWVVHKCQVINLRNCWFIWITWTLKLKGNGKWIAQITHVVSSQNEHIKHI
jgi:hypothetical protein